MQWKPNTTARPLMIALVMGTLSLSAWAQSPASPAPVSAAPASQAQVQAGEANASSRASPWREHRLARQQERQARALASLGQALQLQAGQQAAWQRFEEAMKARPARVTVSSASKASAQDLPAQLAQLKAHKAQRDAAFEQRVQATLDLHASLEPKQQQVLAERAGRWLQRMERQGGHRQHMGHRHGGDHLHPQGPMRGQSHAQPA